LAQALGPGKLDRIKELACMWRWQKKTCRINSLSSVSYEAADDDDNSQ
jgi:hypothetical protein